MASEASHSAALPSVACSTEAVFSVFSVFLRSPRPATLKLVPAMITVHGYSSPAPSVASYSTAEANIQQWPLRPAIRWQRLLRSGSLHQLPLQSATLHAEVFKASCSRVEASKAATIQLSSLRLTLYS